MATDPLAASYVRGYRRATLTQLTRLVAELAGLDADPDIRALAIRLGDAIDRRIQDDPEP